MVKKIMTRIKNYIDDEKDFTFSFVCSEKVKGEKENERQNYSIYCKLITILLLFGMSIIIIPKWGWIAFFEIVIILLILLSLQLLISKRLRIKKLEVDDEVRKSLEMHMMFTHITAIILYFVALLLLLTW